MVRAVGNIETRDAGCAGMTEIPEFQSMPKIPRFFRDVIVTEKIDGTCAAVWIPPNEWGAPPEPAVRAGGKTRWLTVGRDAQNRDLDNYGFAAWVTEHADELRTLGPGLHRGEWWGHKVNRGYGRTDRAFSLFNVGRWINRDPELDLSRGGGPLPTFPDGTPMFPERDTPPACCDVVPVLYRGPFDTEVIRGVARMLEAGGSVAAPGYTKPEGVVVFHAAGGHLFKYTFGSDGVKGSGS